MFPAVEDPPTPPPRKAKKVSRAAAPSPKSKSPSGIKMKVKRKKNGSDDDGRERNSDEEFERMLEEADDVYKQELASKPSTRKRTVLTRLAPITSTPVRALNKRRLKKPAVKKAP